MEIATFGINNQNMMTVKARICNFCTLTISRLNRCQRLQLHYLLFVHDAVEREVHEASSERILLDAKYRKAGFDACCSSIGRCEPSDIFEKQWKALAKASAPPLIKLYFISLGVNDTLKYGLATDAPVKLPVFFFKGIELLCCKSVLETGLYPD